MPEIARWSIRPVAMGDIHKNSVELERKIIPIYGPVLVGTMNHFPEPSGEWNYELLEIDEEINRALIQEITKQKPGLEGILRSKKFESVVRINPEKYGQISRFHSMFGVVNGDLFILDLESKNGTYAGGSQLEQGFPIMLTDNRVITLGGKGEDSARFKAYEAIPFASVLLVGVDYKKGAETEIEKSVRQMDQMIRKLRVPNEYSIMMHGAAKKTDILTHLRSAAELPENNLFFFFYDAHGSRDAITTRDGEITKAELTEHLNRIKAKKVVLIDACHAEGGWNDLDLESGLYFFSSKEDEKSKWGEFAPRFAERVSELLNTGEPVDLKKMEISDLAREHTPVKKGYKSIILF